LSAWWVLIERERIEGMVRLANAVRAADLDNNAFKSWIASVTA
jgi:hypothetical protein